MPPARHHPQQRALTYAHQPFKDYEIVEAQQVRVRVVQGACVACVRRAGVGVGVGAGAGGARAGACVWRAKGAGKGVGAGVGAGAGGAGLCVCGVRGPIGALGVP